MLVDSHCHLDFDAYDPDRAETIARARAAGVGAMVTICTQLSKFDRVREIAESEPDIWCSVGVHPHEAAGEGVDAPDALVRLARHPKVVGIGESGLDFHYDHSPRAAQRANFRAHIAAARETGLPLIVHAREADEEAAQILREEASNGELRGVMHCFTSGRSLAEAALEIGFYVSLSGIVTFRNADDLRDIARELPLDRLLVETDAPYLSPVPVRNVKRNEPAFVAHTARFLAGLRGMEEGALAEATTDNFYRLFTRAVRPAAARP
jgi:TatD DNase family protein